MAEGVGTGVEIRWAATARQEHHGVPEACTLSVVLGHPAEAATSYTGVACLRWRGRLDAGGCHILDVLAEDHRQERPPYVIVFHSQPLLRPQRRRGNRRR